MGRLFRVWSFRVAGGALMFFVIVTAVQFGLWVSQGEPQPVSKFPVEPGVTTSVLSGSQLLPPGATDVKALNDYWYEFTLDGHRHRMLAVDHASLAVAVMPEGVIAAGWQLPEPYRSRAEKHIADGGRIDVQQERRGLMLVFRRGPGSPGAVGAPPEDAQFK